MTTVTPPIEHEFLSELETHYQAVLTDYNNSAWETCHTHVQTYNRVALRALQMHPVFEEIEPVAPLSGVPRSSRTSAQMGKMAELVEKWQVLRTSAHRARAELRTPGNPDYLIEILRRIANRFGLVAAQLQSHSHRLFKIRNESDVQALLHALLCLWFDDIRPEDCVPSNAGATSRVDFLLPREQAVIETKMARPGLDARRLGEELIVDIGRYRAHPRCKLLFCFVYDPDGTIANPRGIESDLMDLSSEGLMIEVAIRPVHA